MKKQPDTRRKVTISLTPEQFCELEALMRDDGQSNFTFYFVYLIMQEKKARLAAQRKRPVGRPTLKESTYEDDDTLYPAPYKDGGAYTRAELVGYYEFRKEPMPPLPKPLTPEELKKYT